MADFNRNNRFQRGGDRGGFKRRDFSDRPSRGPVEMHKAVCDKCGNECEVPFKPTSGKPVYCNNCFDKNGASQDRRPESRNWNSERSNDREMFDAVCDNCGKNCQIPFRPTNGRPVYCSDCFEKGNNEPRNSDSRDSRGSRDSQPQYKEELQELNTKLDKILGLLSTTVLETPITSVAEETPTIEKKRKSAKTTELPVQE